MGTRVVLHPPHYDHVETLLQGTVVYGASTFLDGNLHESCRRFEVGAPRHFVTCTPSSSAPGLGSVPCEAMLCNDDHHMSGNDGESRKKRDVRGEILPC